MIPSVDHYWLLNANVPASLLNIAHSQIGASAPSGSLAAALGEKLVQVNLEIAAGHIATILPAQQTPVTEQPTVDLKKGQVWPCFVDMHTHLDKGHIWERSPNPTRTFNGALETAKADQEKYWQAEDVYRRMEFGLKCSYAHGTKAVRTHLDAFGEQAAISLSVFKALRQEWADRLILQAVSLVPLDYFLTPEGEALADQIAEAEGILGGLALSSSELDDQLDRVFELAQERHLNLDFHTDENGDPQSIAMRKVAEAAIRHDFSGQIVCGHCCSMAVQATQAVQATLDAVQQAGIGVVSLPMCNLYLQDRQQEASRQFLQTADKAPDAAPPLAAGYTPRWRGVTLLHELRAAGIPVAVASDNCRDPFHGFGDHDVLEVFNLSTRIAHLDSPYDHWPQAVTRTPAHLMGLPTVGQITAGSPADLVLFKGRSFSELLSRSQHDRIVLRNGKPIDTTLPDYAELDDLMFKEA